MKTRHMTEKVQEQICNIRDSGLTNMLDWKVVQYLAYQRSFYDLADFIEEYQEEYLYFIFYGDKRKENMKKFEAWEKVNDGKWEQDIFSGPIEAADEKDALELYLASIEDRLSELDAERIDDGCPHSATFKYWDDSESEISTLTFKVKEMPKVLPELTPVEQD